ncbi:MAG: hypothetical protein LBM77_02010, partial [Spirochaetaceae bacterium]|nr:hypothetical protein [Spirochaetaceae bacterium]
MEQTDIQFDSSSPFSLDEQQQILSKIDSAVQPGGSPIAESAKQVDAEIKTEAKKRGGIFPLLVNLGAIAVLLGGAYALYFFQSAQSTEIRKGQAGSGIAEQAIIDAIRQDAVKAANANTPHPASPQRGEENWSSDNGISPPSGGGRG